MNGESSGDLLRLELLCFGPPTARVGGDTPPPDVLWRKHLALLVYLALSPDLTRTREHLLGLLWPEKTQDKARHSLNEATRRLRTGLGANRLISRGDSLTLNRIDLDVDALRFDDLAQRDPEAATALLRGDFLEGFTVDGSTTFEDWSSERRSHYRAVGARLLVREGETALAASRFPTARDTAREALALLPGHEPAVSLAMRAAALSGDASSALAVFHEFRERLQDELGEAPSRELEALAERIRSERWRRLTGRHADPEPALIMQPGVHDRAFAVVEEGVRSGARALVITGDPGLGKTRLLTESVERLQLAGAAVVVARPLESDHDAPWSALRQLMHAGLADATGLAGADPDALGVLAAIVPDLADRFDSIPPRDVGHVVTSLTSLLRAVADEHPLGIALDDAHFADGSTLGALGEAIRQVRSAGVVLILATQPASEDLPRELVKLLGDVGRGIPGTIVQLAPLADQAMVDLVAGLAGWCETPDDRDRLARRIIHEAQGNPFLAVTLLRDLQQTSTLKRDLLSWPPPRETYESPLPNVPAPVRMAIVARFSALAEETRQVLRVASIGGLALDPALIAALTDLPESRVEDQVDRLEQARFVTFEGERFAFAAPLLAEVVCLECLTPGQRERLRKRAIGALAERTDVESRVLRAELRARVEPGPNAFADAVAVAHAALENGSDRTARRALHAAQRAARGCGEDAQATLAELRTKFERA